jgi:hypothetical protein
MSLSLRPNRNFYCVMTKEEYKKMLVESGGVTDSANKKSVENHPQIDKKDGEILDKV